MLNSNFYLLSSQSIGTIYFINSSNSLILHSSHPPIAIIEPLPVITELSKVDNLVGYGFQASSLPKVGALKFPSVWHAPQ